MHPPRHICEALARDVHPWLRVAWHGEERKHADDLNAGSFAIVQLYHIRDAGSQDEPNTFLLEWEPGFGPVFNKHGGTVRDWDPLFRRPMYAMRCKDVGISNEDVLTGRALPKIIAMLRRKGSDVLAERQKRGLDFDREATELAEEMTDKLWYEANKTGAESVDVPWEFARDEVAKVHRKKEIATRHLQNMFMPYTRR